MNLFNLDATIVKLHEMYNAGGLRRKIARKLKVMVNTIHSCDIPLTCTIGKNVHFGHGGIGVVIHNDAIICDRCVIMQNVTIGGGNGGVPYISNDVSIGAGAVILGGVTIGEFSEIGAKAVVVRDVNPYSVVGGVPASVLYVKNNSGENNDVKKTDS